MRNVIWPKVGTIALGEAGAILKSPGFIMAALAPFALVAIAIVALFYFQSQDPRVALTIESDDPAIADAIAGELSKALGPKADKAQLRDAQAGHWYPIVRTFGTVATVELDGAEIPIGATSTFNTKTGDLSITLMRPVPPYLVDLIRAETYDVMYGHVTGLDIKTEITTPAISSGAVKSLDAQLIWLLTVLMATASGALAAASTHALATAFLDRPNVEVMEAEHAQEDFLGKLIGIGSAYATLALPWGIVLACGLGALTWTGDPNLIFAVKQVTVSGFDPFRLILFLLCAPAGYVLFGSIALMFAMHSKRRPLLAPLRVPCPSWRSRQLRLPSHFPRIWKAVFIPRSPGSH